MTALFFFLLPALVGAEQPLSATQPAREVLKTVLPASAPEQWRELAKKWRDQIVQERQQIIPQMRKNLADRNDNLRNVLGDALDDAAENAFLFLALLPLPLLWLYYRQFWQLVKYCLLSAVLFYLAIQLFQIPLYFLQLMTGHLSEEINPRLLIADETYAVMHQHLEGFLQNRNDPLALPLRELLNYPLDLTGGILYSNLQWLNRELWVFDWITDLYRKLDWLLAQLPLLLTLAGAILFAASDRSLFARIALLPLRAVQGEKKLGRQILKFTFRNWLEELVAVVPVLGLLFLLSLGSAWLLGQSVRETVEVMFFFTVAATGYLSTQTSPSSFLLFTTLMSVWVVLLFNVGVVFVANLSYMASAMRIFRRVCHERISIRTDARFWLVGTLALVWVEVLPAGYVWGSFELSERIFRHYLSRTPADYSTPMLLSAGILVLGLFLIFWLLRGFQALWSLCPPIRDKNKTS